MLQFKTLICMVFKPHPPVRDDIHLVCSGRHDVTENRIEDFFLDPAMKNAIILLLYRAHIKVLKDALVC